MLECGIALIVGILHCSSVQLELDAEADIELEEELAMVTLLYRVKSLCGCFSCSAFSMI